MMPSALSPSSSVSDRPSTLDSTSSVCSPMRGAPAGADGVSPSRRGKGCLLADRSDNRVLNRANIASGQHVFVGG